MVTLWRGLLAACIILASLACGQAPEEAAQAPGEESAQPSEEDAKMTQSQQDRRIDYIEFGVADMAKTKEFYGAAFGWKFTDYGPDYTSFEDGRLTGGFTTQTKVVPGGPLVVLYAKNIEELESEVRKHGGSISREIFEFPGGRRFHFTDPSGNELAVWSDN